MKAARLSVLALCLVAAPAQAELLLSGEHSWGVDRSPRTDEVTEYWLCDATQQCEYWAEGDPRKAGAPVRVENTVSELRTLRARFCTASIDGVATENCSPLSEASAPFRFAPEISATQLLMQPEGAGDGELVVLGPGETYRMRLPLGIAPPISDPKLHLAFNTTQPGARVASELRGVKNSNQVYWYGEDLIQGFESVVHPLQSLDQALQDGEHELELSIRCQEGNLLLRLGDPLNSTGLTPPHLSARTLLGTLITFFDGDADGVAEWPAPGLGSCESDRWLGCTDSCPSDYDASQRDFDADGTGDACMSAYQHGACLQHWWRPGYDTQNMGADYGTAAHPIDVLEDAPYPLVSPRDVRHDSDGSYLELNGISEYLANLSPSPLGIDNTWTVALWVRPESLHEYILPVHPLVRFDSVDPHGANSWSFGFDSSVPGAPLRFRMRDHDGDLGKDFLYSGLLNEGDWVHLALVWDGRNLELFADGELEEPSERLVDRSAVRMENERVFTRIGSNGEDLFEGDLHSVAIWRKVLSAEAIREIHNDGNRDYDLSFGLGSIPCL